MGHLPNIGSGVRKWSSLRDDALHKLRGRANIASTMAKKSKLHRLAETVFNNQKFSTGLRVIADNAVQLRSLLNDPSLPNILLTAGTCLSSVTKIFEFYSIDYFDEWECICSAEIATMVVPYIQAAATNTQVLVGIDKENHIKLYELPNGLVLGHCVNSGGAIRPLFVKNSNTDVMTIVADMFWKAHVGKTMVIVSQKQKNQFGFDSRSETFTAIEDSWIKPYSSELAEKQSASLKAAVEKKIPRAVLYYGPPGTGKSTLCRSIVSKLGMTSLRVRFKDLVNNEELFTIVKSLKTDAIIIDDIDRSNSEFLLELLELLQRTVKLVLATANDKNEIDEACLRPGRFDELVYVDTLDENVVRSILGTYIEDIDIVKQWPIAFIIEYKKRRSFMPNGSALSSMRELEQRIKRLRRYDNDMDQEDLFKTSAKKTKKQILAE